MEDFVTYEQAVKLKELGFDWECNHLYSHRSSIDFNDSCYYHDFNTTDSSNDYSAPTLAQAQKWLREVKETEVIVHKINDSIYNYTIYGQLVNLTTKTIFDTYEQALSAGIDKALELLKEE